MILDNHRIRILACAAVVAATGVDAAAADLAGVAAWAGKYPFDRVGGRQFYDYPGLRAEMRKTVGAGVYRALQGIRGPTVPVVHIGDYVAAWQCMAHDCGDKNTTTIVRLSKGDVVVCWRNAPGGATRWFVPGRAPIDRVDEGGRGCPSEAAEIHSAIRRLGL